MRDQYYKLLDQVMSSPESFILNKYLYWLRLFPVRLLALFLGKPPGANAIKLFTSMIYGFSKQAIGFVPCKYF